MIEGVLVLPPISRRAFVNSVAAVGAAAEGALLTAGCAQADDEPDSDKASNEGASRSPYEYGAVGDGKHDDTAAFRAAYDAALAQGGGVVELARGRFYIPGHLEMPQPGVSLVASGGAVVGGGEVRIGPPSYDEPAYGIHFSGDRVSGIVFDNDDDFGSARCLVLRNVRGLDVSQNYFRSGGKGIAVETADGNEKLHTTAMLRISSNRFTRLTFGVYADTVEWDRLSDWQITNNYFNYCSDTSVWIACTDSEQSGGVDGLDFAGNTVFSLTHRNSQDDPRFAKNATICVWGRRTGYESSTIISSRRAFPLFISRVRRTSRSLAIT